MLGFRGPGSPEMPEKEKWEIPKQSPLISLISHPGLFFLERGATLPILPKKTQPLPHPSWAFPGGISNASSFPKSRLCSGGSSSFQRHFWSPGMAQICLSLSWSEPGSLLSPLFPRIAAQGGLDVPQFKKKPQEIAKSPKKPQFVFRTFFSF